MLSGRKRLRKEAEPTPTRAKKQAESAAAGAKVTRGKGKDCGGSGSYEALLTAQCFEGYWSAWPRLKTYLNKQSLAKVPKEIIDVSADEEMAKRFWFTILALYILETQFASTQSDWKLVAQKAKRYLQSNGKIKYADVKHLVKV